MTQDAKSRQELMEEVAALRGQVAELKKLEAEFKTVEQELRCSEMQYRKLFENARHGIVILDGHTGLIKNANPHLLEMLGYSAGEIVGRKLTEIEAFIDSDGNKAAFDELKEKNHNRYEDVPLETRSGRRLDVEIESNVCSIDENRVVHYHIHDNTERKRMDREIRLIATHDPMTGLPNRTLFLDRAHIAVMHAHRHEKKVAVVSIDLDKFSAVNETMGNDIGDRALKAVATRFASIVRKSDTIARVGGDEFALVLPDIDNVDAAVKIASKLVDAFRQQFIINGRQLIVTISAGVALYPDDGRDIEDLMNCADRLMYKVRAEGCNNFKLSGVAAAK